MRTISLAHLWFFLYGCPVAKAYDTPEIPKCVIDLCDKDICVIETPEGTAEVKKKPEYKEGAVIDCPDNLSDLI